MVVVKKEMYQLWKKENVFILLALVIHIYYSQSKSSVHDKLHKLHSHFPPIAQRTPSIITSICWKSTVSDVTASGIDRKKGCVQNVTCSLALTIRNLYDYKTKEYGNLLTSQSSSLWFQRIYFLSYMSPLFWTHIHFWLTGQTNLWRSEHASFSINTGWPGVTAPFQQFDVIIEGVLWAIGGKLECSSWSLSCTDDLLWL